MKDLLQESLKLESKIQTYHLLHKYYRGDITWLEYKNEVTKVLGTVKALLEEADVKPVFRQELESHTYPLDYWFTSHKQK